MVQKRLTFCKHQFTIRIVVNILQQNHIFKGVLIIGNLSRVRKAQGLSQEQLSKLSGISRVTISRIESGKESPKIRTLLTLSRVLKVPLADIVEKAG